MSIAGGIHRAVERAREVRCRAVQIFTRSNVQWACRPLGEEESGLWRAAIAASGLVPLVHDSYLINLASPDRALFERSRRAFLEEVQRADRLGIGLLVFHPGSHMGAGERPGLDRIVSALDWVIERTPDTVTLLLENTAGQGSALGWSLEHLEIIRSGVRIPERTGICIDTCHLLAAGYDFRTEEGYGAVFGEIERRFGRGTVKAFHLNDSKKDLGCRVDRHEHIGAGYVGNRGFSLLLGDPRFRGVPMVLETPKGDAMDRKNLARLRRLASRARTGRAAPGGGRE
jgi:deoxyribonuclease-4